MPNYTYGIARDAPLAGATQLYDSTVIFYTENPLVGKKSPNRQNDDLLLLTYSIIFFTRIFVRITYFLKYNLVS
ncbi:MAG: hypothetical protein LBU34_06275 [Planctomycetaceae bacterium]|nr:hypothetical protein [Planctomycetaceae bacterium]